MVIFLLCVPQKLQSWPLGLARQKRKSLKHGGGLYCLWLLFNKLLYLTSLLLLLLLLLFLLPSTLLLLRLLLPLMALLLFTQLLLLAQYRLLLLLLIDFCLLICKPLLKCLQLILSFWFRCSLFFNYFVLIWYLV